MDKFVDRHIGPRAKQEQEMLKAIGYSSIQELIDKTIPSNIRLNGDLNLDEGLSESDYLEHIEAIGKKNIVSKQYIGMGYYPTIVPPTIQRNILENPGWYTAYTPYQAEIAQGRLEALLNFQTMVSDLTGMELANASLLDEGTAGAEAMIMFLNTRSRAKAKSGANKFFCDTNIFPQTIDVVKMRAEHLDIELVFGDFDKIQLDETYFGAMLQYPAGDGGVFDYTEFVADAQEKEIKVAVASDLMALTQLTPPGEWGADVVFGNSQRFGVPMGYGGPHAAFFATKEAYKRNIPGRIIGVSQDRRGVKGYRMALQTREQHIRRDKATSNICTAQALLAVMASMYAVYHGPQGINDIAQDIHSKTKKLASALSTAGNKVINSAFFDTLLIEVTGKSEDIKVKAEKANINFRYFENSNRIGISLAQGVSNADLSEIAELFGATIQGEDFGMIPEPLVRTSAYLTHPIFNSHHSETEMMRYMKKLENKDLSLTHSMIALGSCTMKLNAAAELMPVTFPEFANMHPFCPVDQAQGYAEMLTELRSNLSEITGFADVSLQPNSGAQGEYAGLLVIRAYHKSRGDSHRNICLIPSSAHGTNPASAVMAGMKVVVVKCDENGNVDVEDLRAKATEHSENLGAFMITYPSTHGVFEESIIEINEIIHANGGQVYMDGANMNAQVGLTNPGRIGADVCHLNLHKTFAIPHGGGGPGMGPIGVAAHLIPFLPGNPNIKTGGDQAISSVSAAPWGSALILLISYAYIKMLGKNGLRKSTELAILNANYIKARLEKEFDILYVGKNGTVAHEMIVDCRSFKTDTGVEVEDIAKRLMDYGFHAPTVSFPVAGTVMIEPTESEPKEELDRFCDALLSIRKEIEEIKAGTYPKDDNVLKQAPHVAQEICANEWSHSYSREKAAFPLPYVRDAKFWVSASRVDNAFGDRNLICACPPIEMYEEALDH